MGNKKHILFISSWYPNRTNPTHGIFNRYFVEAAAINSQVSVLHVCSEDSLTNEFEFNWKEEQGIVTLIVYYKKISGTTSLISRLKKRQRLLRAFDLGYEKLQQKYGKPDLMQLNVIMPAGIGVKHLSAKHGIPYVINEGWSGYCPEDGSYKGFFQKYYTQRIAAGAEAIMPVSDYLKEAMLSHNLIGNYTVVPNVVDIHLFVPKEKEESPITKYVHISTLDDVQKNVSGIIRAFKNVQQINPHTELTIIGENADKEILQKLANDLGLSDQIIFKGRLKIEQIVNEINASDVLVMFSNYETFSLVIAEAFACGKPVITSRAGGLTDFVTPDLGFIVEKKNEEQLADAMLNFALHKKNYDRKHIRDYVLERYSKEKIGEQLNQVYDRVLSLITN